MTCVFCRPDFDFDPESWEDVEPDEYEDIQTKEQQELRQQLEEEYKDLIGLDQTEQDD